MRLHFALDMIIFDNRVLTKGRPSPASGRGVGGETGNLNGMPFACVTIFACKRICARHVRGIAKPTGLVNSLLSMLSCA
jgi:hypothetical protein